MKTFDKYYLKIIKEAETRKKLENFQDLLKNNEDFSSF